MWHELVLAGIGGNSIEEAQRNLSYQEVQRWAAYRLKRGSLNPARHIERGIALLCKTIVDTLPHRRRGAEPVSLYKFMPHEDEPEISLEEAMNTWK